MSINENNLIIREKSTNCFVDSKPITTAAATTKRAQQTVL